MKSKVLVSLAMLASIQLVHSAELNQDGAKSSQITIAKLGGTYHRVDISEMATVGGLKAKISQLDGTPASNLILVFGGQELDDDSKLLIDHGIQQDSKVIFMQRSTKSASASNGGDVKPTSASEAIENLFVRNPKEGVQVKVPAEAELTVGQLKHFIGLLIPVFQNGIGLEYNGAALEDHKSLAESGLRNNSTVDLIIGQAPQSALLKHVINRHVASLVDQINNNGKPDIDFIVTHNSDFTDLEIVTRMIEKRLVHKYEAIGNSIMLMSDALKSEDLRIEFGYEFRGERKSTLANLKDGAKWIVDQAKAAVAKETV